jgi:hypothetical protein
MRKYTSQHFSYSNNDTAKKMKTNLTIIFACFFGQKLSSLYKPGCEKTDAGNQKKTAFQRVRGAKTLCFSYGQ